MLGIISGTYHNRESVGRVKKRLNISILLLLMSLACFSQSGHKTGLKPSDSLNKQRRNFVIITEGSAAIVGLFALNELWYKDFPRSSFHAIDDVDEWLQMDKFGHVFSSYQISRLGTESLRWSGVDAQNSRLYGSILSFGFLTTIEIFDGFSKEWGFSWSDFTANTIGSGLFIGQDHLWHEQRILFKYSFHQTYFASIRPDKLGENFSEEVFKDYNGQTYWLSFNLKAFFKKSKIPAWLNIAAGYGAHGMVTGLNENVDMSFNNFNRFRQYYLSLDVDLSRIKTNSHVLKTVFSVINVIKIPFPTLEFNSEKGVVFHLLYF